MRASIVVLNYNYARFVAQAIDSALAQDHADTEVVVVDNGSTDGSPEVIAAYANRVRIVRQPVNIGQGQGYNLGFEAATGEWIVWLDADDVFDTDTISSCLALVKHDTAKVQFPLRLIDGQSRPLIGMVPYLRHQGDVTPIIKRFGHYGGPPGSGNLYRRSAVAPYFPVTPSDWTICTDTVPFVVAPFHGKVADTGQPLGCYRLHRKLPSAVPGYRGNFSSSMGDEVRLNYASRDKTLAMLRVRSGIDVPGPFLTLPPHVRHRIISWRWAPESHPFPADTAHSLRHLMSESVNACPGYTAVERLAMRAWAHGVLLLPERMAGALMATNRSAPFWDRLIRWSNRLST